MTAKQIMEKNFYVTKVKAFKADSTMVLFNAQGEKRERKLANVQALEANGVDSKTLAKFLEPADVRGTMFLQIEHSGADDDQWIFLPALQKSRRLVANNKKDSFFGSDFSLCDISLPKVEAYSHRLTGMEAVGGADCYVVESVPATDQLKDDTGYSKKVSWIRKDNFIEAKVDYYDLNGELFKTQTTSGYQQASRPIRTAGWSFTARWTMYKPAIRRFLTSPIWISKAPWRTVFSPPAPWNAHEASPAGFGPVAGGGCFGFPLGG